MRQWFVGGIVSRMAGNIFSEGGQKILERIDRLLRKVEQDKAANTVYISYIANLHLGNENTFPIVVQLWNGKQTVDSTHLCKTFSTEEEAEAYIAKLYKEYPAPQGRENGPTISYPKVGQELAEPQGPDDEQAEVV